MRPKLETQRLKEALKCRANLDETLVQKGAGLIRAEGLDRAMAFWLSQKERGRGLAAVLSKWWSSSPATSFLWPDRLVKPIKILDALFLLPPHQMELLGEEAEAFLTEIKYAQAAVAATQRVVTRAADETSAAEGQKETEA
jgi:hypothetical protein